MLFEKVPKWLKADIVWILCKSIIILHLLGYVKILNFQEKLGFSNLVLAVLFFVYAIFVAVILSSFCLRYEKLVYEK